MRFFKNDPIVRAEGITAAAADALWYGDGTEYRLDAILTQGGQPNIAFNKPPATFAGKWLVFHIPQDGAVHNIDPNAPPWINNEYAISFQADGIVQKTLPITQRYNYIRLDDHITAATDKIEIDHGSLVAHAHITQADVDSLKITRLALLTEIGGLKYTPMTRGSLYPKRKQYKAINGVVHVSAYPSRLELQMDFKGHYEQDAKLMETLSLEQSFWCWPNDGQSGDGALVGADWARRDVFRHCVVSDLRGFDGVRGTFLGGSFGKVRIAETGIDRL